MRLIHIFAVFILSISCSQKDIVEDYQRRIANTYSYTQNKIGTRASAPFISIEVELYNQCKKKKDQEKSKCLADSYNLIFANPELSI